VDGLDEEGDNTMYAITHDGKAIGPNGLITDVEGTPLLAEHAADYNQQVEAQEIAWLKTHPDKCTLYVKMPERDTAELVGNGHYCDVAYRPKVTTWMGTVLAQGANCWIGPRARVGFGYHTYRRPITAVIFGCTYHGWYMESSGDYCRLKKAKRQ
jgi:hypothetical protein